MSIKTTLTDENEFDVNAMNDDLMGNRAPRKQNPQNMGQSYNNDEEEHVIVIKPKEPEAPSQSDEESAEKAEKTRQAHLNNWQVALQNENTEEGGPKQARILPRQVYLRSPVDFHL